MEQTWPDPKFAAVVERNGQHKSGMNLKSSDKVIGRITASAGMSLFSWGENLTIIVEKINENSTLVAIESTLKMGANLAG